MVRAGGRYAIREAEVICICTRVQTGCKSDAPGCRGKNVPGCRGCRRTRVQIPGKPIYQRAWSLIGNSSFSRVKLPRAESTSFTSMGSQVRVLLRPPTRKSLEKSRLFLFYSLPRRGCIFPRRQGAFLDVNKMNDPPVHASRCERVPGVDVNSLPVSM